MQNLGIGMQAWASECVLEMAVPPVAASAYWTLQSAAAMVATQLGTTLRYIMQQHSMWHMAQVGTLKCPVPSQIFCTCLVLSALTSIKAFWTVQGHNSCHSLTCVMPRAGPKRLLLPRVDVSTHVAGV